mgnify:FL=1
MTLNFFELSALGVWLYTVYMNIDEIYTLMNGTPKTEADKALIQKAYLFAQKAHEGQKRASGDPYFLHVFGTAKNLARFGMDATTISAVLLHDTIEDTEVTGEDIEREFGKDILFLVNGVTKLGKLKYQGRERHVESLRKFFLAVAEDFRVFIIKLADRLHNLRTLEYVKPEKQKRIAIEAIEVYAPLANRLGIGKVKGEIEDAAFPFAYPKEYAKVEEIIKDKVPVYEASLQKINEKLKEDLTKQNVHTVELSARMKHKYSLWKKLERYKMDMDKIYDIVALRVIVKDVEECYRVLGIVHSIWRPLPNRIKDYIALPKTNGYQSIHTTVFTGDGGIAEIQIRTEEMHGRAEYGIASHFSYKEMTAAQKEKTPHKFEWVNQFKLLDGDGITKERFEESLKLDVTKNRIFVFTPEGDVIDLPEESSPIDFAYAVHSEIGDKALSAKINGKMSKLGTKLKNGDIVEIATGKNEHPSTKWLDYAKTTVARKHIRQYIDAHGGIIDSILKRFK